MPPNAEFDKTLGTWDIVKSMPCMERKKYKCFLMQ